MYKCFLLVIIHSPILYLSSIKKQLYIIINFIRKSTGIEINSKNIIKINMHLFKIPKNVFRFKFIK